MSAIMRNRCAGLITNARPWLISFALLLAGAQTGSAADSAASAPSAVPANGEMGFVLTAFSPAIYPGKADCPDGFANTVEENYLSTLSADERARLQKKENEKELEARWKSSAVDSKGRNICSDPELFNHPAQKTIQGKIAYGLNLDGDTSGNASVNTCGHEKFTSPTGELGIDNQAYRAMGCTRNYKGADWTGGEIVKGYNDFLATGEHSMVMLLRGVHSLVNDDNVEIIFGTTDDQPILDSTRHFVRGASFTLSRNPNWRNVLHGKIVNGVLITDPADIHMTRRFGIGGTRGERMQWDLFRSRFRLAFQPDGSLQGLFGAYQPFADVIAFTMQGGVGAATTANIDCASEYAALKKLADGLRDPKTGECSAISIGFNVSAVPAYVFDRAPTKAAQGGSAAK